MSAITAQITGQLIVAKTAQFTDNDGVKRQYGKIQVLVPDASGDFYTVQNIKVKQDKFNELQNVDKNSGQLVKINVSIQTYGQRSDYFYESLAVSRQQQAS